MDSVADVGLKQVDRARPVQLAGNDDIVVLVLDGVLAHRICRDADCDMGFARRKMRKGGGGGGSTDDECGLLSLTLCIPLSRVTATHTTDFPV